MEWYEVMVKLKEQGKIRAIGVFVGDWCVFEVNSYIEVGWIDVVMVVYNVLEQELEYILFFMVKKYQVGIVVCCLFSFGVLVSDWIFFQKFFDGDWWGLWILDDWVVKYIEMVDYIKLMVKNINLFMLVIGLKYILNY